MFVESIIKTMISCFVILGLILIYRVSVHQLAKTTSEKLWFAFGMFLLFSLVTVFFNQSLSIENSNVRYFNAVAFELMWWLSLYYFINQMLQHWIWDNLYLKKGIPFSRVFRDIVSIFLFLLTLIGIVHFVFDKSVFGIFTASGVLVIIVAYSAQVYLSDVFAGMELHNAKEITVGDWIKVNDHVAQVVQINWHYVRLITKENNQLSVANSILSKLPIINLSHPTAERAVLLTIPLMDNTSPGDFKKMLITAALQSPKVLRTPAPSALLLRLEKDTTVYQLTYYTQEIDESRVNNDILSMLWYMSRRQNIKITANHPSGIEMPSQQHLQAFIKKNELFQVLSKEEIAELSAKAICHHYGPPERVLEQGQENSSLYLIYSGSVDIYLTHEIPALYVATLVAGEHFGEMSFLTGETCNASVFIKDEAIIIEISHDNIADLFAKKPSLVAKISKEVVSRKQENEELHISALNEHKTTSTNILDRLVDQIKSFFHLS